MKVRLVALLALIAALLAVPGTAAYAGQAAQTVEAEDGVLDGVVIESSASGYSGAGYVAGFDTATDTLTMTIPDSPGGLYSLTVRYSAPFGTKTATLRLNGAGLGDVVLTETTAFTGAAAGNVLLREGDNTVTIVNNWGWYYIDAITVEPVDPPPPHQVTGTLVNPHATDEAKGLMRYLTDNFGKNLISGQQDMASVDWVREHVGATPAIAGLDMMDYSPSRVERGATSEEVERALQWDAEGGITTFVWHWNAPTGLIDEPGKEWWRGFYTDATTFDLAAALADKDSEGYRLLIRDMDAIAVQLKRLADADVPVLWRPLHEAEGGWFWWGAKGPEAAKELWRLLYDRLTNHHKLNNLIWVWNSVSPAWYPGDDVVDVVSTDSYPPAGDHGPISGAYEKLVDLGGNRKLVALGEVGSIPDPALARAYYAHWSYFVTWSGSFVQDGQHNSTEFLKRVYQDPGVITRDELGDFKNHGSGCTAGYRVLGSWTTGFLAEVTIRNTGPATTRSWTVRWRPSAGQAVTRHWNTELTLSDGRITAGNARYNAVLRPGGTTAFGFLATGPGAVPAHLSCTTAPTP